MNSFVERLGWMLLHSLWQFTLVAFLVGVLVRLARNRSSALRYGILAVSLFASILFPIATWGLLPASESVAGTATHQASSFESRLATEAAPTRVRAMNVKGSEIASGAVPADLILPQLPRRPDVELETSEIASQPLESTSHVLYEVHVSWFGQIQKVLRPWLAWIVLGWCLGVAICSLRPLFGWYTLWRLQRFGVSPVPDDILVILRRVSDRIGLRQTVRVMYSTLAQVPVVVGYLRPVILLPVSLMSSIPAAQLEAILAHELAHVRRHDFIVNLLQTIVETVFFYHPAVWWLSHQIRVEREHCCDDRVVSLLGNRVEYGRALLALEQLRGQTLLLAQGAADGSLVSRIRRIVLAPAGNSYRSAWWGLCCSALLLVGVTYAATAMFLPETSVTDSPYQVTLPDGSAVELLGITADGVDPAQWWSPNGEILKEAPLDVGRVISAPDWKDQRRFAVRSVRAEHLRWFFNGDGQFSSCGKLGQGTDNFRETVITPSKCPSFEPTTIHCGVGLGTFGPWVRLDLIKGREQLPVLPLGLEPCYKAIEFDRAEQTSGKTELFLKPYRVDTYLMSPEREWVAIAKDRSRRHATQNSLHWPLTPKLLFDVPIDAVDHFEFRLRPARYWVKFENVSLRLGQKTDVKVTPLSAPFVPADKLDVDPPGGAKVEKEIDSRPTLASAAQISDDSLTQAEKPIPNPKLAVEPIPAVTTIEIEKWLQEFDSSDSSRQTQAAVQIEKRYAQHPPGTVDVLLVRGLTKYLDCQQFAASGQNTRQVGDWCKQALIEIGAPAVPELLVLATKGDQNARRRVGECLGAIKVIGPSAVATLIQLLDDAETEVQNSATNALKKVSNEPTLIPQLIKTFENGSLKARSSAVGVLGQFQEDRVEAVLLRALDDSDAQVRAWAAYAVRETPHPKLAPELVRRLKTVDHSTLSTLEGALRLSASKIVPDLLRGLQDESPRARAACVRVLFHVLPDHATLVVPALSSLLQDPDPQVRRSLFQVLCIRAYLFDPALLSEPLLKGLDDPNADVRSSAAEALRAFAEKWPNDRRAIDRLMQKLDDPDPEVVTQVIRALAEFREPRAVPQLIRLAAQEGNAGAAATTALGKLSGQNVIDVLRRNLAKKQPEAIAALGELHDFQSIPTFIELLKDSNEFVRTAAAKALAQNPDPRAIEPLIEGLKAGLIKENFGPADIISFKGHIPMNIYSERNNSTLAIIDALGRSGDLRAIQTLISRIHIASPNDFFDHDFSAWHFSKQDFESDESSTEPTPLLASQQSQHPFAWALFHAGRPAIPELAKGLSSKSASTRELCAWVLDNLSIQGGLAPADFEGIQPILLKALNDKDLVVRYCTVKLMGHLKLRLAEGPLLEMLKSPLSFDPNHAPEFPPYIRALGKQYAIQIQVEVIRALSGIRTVASRTALLHALDNPAPEVRSSAAGHLGEFPAAYTVDPLIKALADPGACAEAARVLGHIGDPRAIPPLVQLLQTSLDPVVKENAAQSLGLLGADNAKPALRDVLVRIPNASARSEGFAIQLAAAISLCQLHDEAGTARIKELLGSSDYETRNQVASKLGLATYFSGWRLPAKLSHEPTREVLREFAEHAPDTPTRLQLVEALGGQLDDKTRTFLERRANDPYEKINWSIWRVLVRPNPATYEVQLLKLLDRPEPRVQIEVAGFLGQLSSERVTERLLQLSFDKDVDVRVAAVMALGLHRTPKVDARLEELSHIDPSPKVRGSATMILQSAPKVGQANKPRSEESELAAREILKGRFGLDLPDPKTEHSPRELILFNIPPAAWEHIGELSDIPAIHVMGGDVRGAPLRQIARIRGLKSLRIVNAKCLPEDLEALAGHPSLESLSAMLSVFEELVINGLQQTPKWESQLAWRGLGILRVLWLQQSVSLGGGNE